MTEDKKIEDHWHGSVLFLLYQGSVILIKRSEDLPSFRGHMAFIGGHRQMGKERESESDPWDVCVREFAEETSLPVTALKFVRYLPGVKSSSQTLIIPVLAELHLAEDEHFNALSNGEWTEMISVPLSTLAQKKFWQYGNYHGRLEQNKTVLFRPLFPHEYKILASLKEKSHGQKAENKKPFLLWGATARMIYDYLF